MTKDKHSVKPACRPDESRDPLALRESALAATAEGVTISDPHLPDNPIIYANAGFERLTGYPVEYVVGRNCRFLQGPGTDPDTVAEIRDAIRQGRGCTVQLLNYRKDGTPFWNRLSVTPLHDAEGKLTHFVGVQSDITTQKRTEEALRQANEQLEAANQRLRQDLEAAAKIQQALLPPSTLQVPGVSLAWAFRPCVELAGDLLNIHPLDENRVALYMIDVSGHGVAAALFAVTLSRLLSAKPDESSLFVTADEKRSGYGFARPAWVAEKLNRQFPFDPSTSQYFTMLYGVLNLETRQFRYVSAGHLGPVYAPLRGKPSDLTSSGFPIGLIPTADFDEKVLQLEPGDSLYLLTDGITEAQNEQGEEFGIHRFLRSLAGTQGSPLTEATEVLMSGVESWCGDAGMKDDASILGCQISPV